MINSNFFAFIASLLFILLISQGCSESRLDAVTTYTLIDIDPATNQVTELLTKNGEEVGLTISTSTSHQVSYQLLDTAGGRFSIDEITGIVYLADQLLLNAHLLPTHTITVQSNFADGSFISSVFDIDVTTSSIDSVININLNNQFNPNLEDELSKEKLSASNKSKFDFYSNDIVNVSQYRLLLDWNDGHGQNFSGWSWLDDVAYGKPGWILKEEGSLGGGEKYAWGWGVRSFNKGDYGKKNTAIIDIYNRAPSSDSGGSLKVMETADSTDHRSTWWLWYDGKPLSERGITNSKTDRMSFYLKTDGMNNLNDDGGKESVSTNFHIGTYLCWKTELPAYGTGDGCPYEGEGNQHYYHYLSINPGAWIHVLLDQHPQHIRGGKSKLKNNPSFISHQKNYFEQLSRFYFEIRYPHENKTNFNVDELQYFSSKDMVEPEQNEESISSLWVGYWRNKGVWEIGFHDQSHDVYNDDNNSTFEIRWSIAPITNANFEQAELIQPMLYNGDKYVGQNAEHLIRRPNGWRSNVWTRFELPDEIEQRYLKVFFAVKDVSVAGEHIGTNWPYNKGDGHDAPTSNIKIIDYYLRPPAN
jgi:hypothetical protein